MNNEKEKELLQKLNDLNRSLAKYKAKEVLSRKQFDYVIGKTKKGNRFIKVIYDSYEDNGWVEVARIHLSKNEWVQNTFSIEDILDDLKD